VLHGVLVSNFILFVVNELIKREIEKLSGQYLSWICVESLTCHGLNLNLRYFICFTFYLCIMWRITFACLVVCSGRCGMTDSDKDHGRSRRPSTEDRRLSYRSVTRCPDDKKVR
jgi:hypothetical protein